MSPGRIRTGMLLAVAVAAAVTMLQAPGPTEEVQAKMDLWRICFCIANSSQSHALPVLALIYDHVA